jgi:hypothetical protein
VLHNLKAAAVAANRRRVNRTALTEIAGLVTAGNRGPVPETARRTTLRLQPVSDQQAPEEEAQVAVSVFLFFVPFQILK